MYKCFLLVLALTALSFAQDGQPADSYYSTPHYSVAVGDIGPGAARVFEEQGFLVEWIHDGRAVLNVSPQQEELLFHLGYIPTRMETATDQDYPTLAEVYASIDAVLAAHPGICREEVIGTSVQDREIRAVVVSANPSVEEVEPELRIQGGIHGDEQASVTTTLHYLEQLTDNYATSPMCQYIVDTAEVWIIPVLNPDGYNADQRSNANGIDLNRNCSYMGPGSGGGSTAFSEPETAALRDITMQNWPAAENFINPFSLGLSLHGGASCINTVWNYTGNPLPEDGTMILQQAVDYDQNPGIVDYFGSGDDFWIAYPGYSWYETHGDVNDWSYGECGTVDHTVEVHYQKHVSDWLGVANAHYMPIMEIFTSGTYGIWGTVENASGDPLDALIEIGISDGGDSEALRFCRTDVTLGDYHKTLLPGTYDVMATVEGYTPQLVTGITLGSEERVEVSFVMDMVEIEEGETGIETTAGYLGIHPNPATGSCRIQLPAGGVGGRLAVYDITGRQVFSREVLAGVSTLTWDCTSDAGVAVPSGMYLARFSTGGSEFSERLVVNR